MKEAGRPERRLSSQDILRRREAYRYYFPHIAVTTQFFDTLTQRLGMNSIDKTFRQMDNQERIKPYYKKIINVVDVDLMNDLVVSQSDRNIARVMRKGLIPDIGDPIIEDDWGEPAVLQYYFSLKDRDEIRAIHGLNVKGVVDRSMAEQYDVQINYVSSIWSSYTRVVFNTVHDSLSDHHAQINGVVSELVQKFKPQ